MGTWVDQARVWKDLVESHDRIWAEWWPALLGLSLDEAVRPVGGSFPSVYATTLHMVGAEWAWQERMEGRDSSLSPSQWAPDLHALFGRYQDLVRRRLAFLERADLQVPLHYRSTDGKLWKTTGEWALLHLLHHAAFHRGQLAAQFRLLGRTPPSLHLINLHREAVPGD